MADKSFIAAYASKFRASEESPAILSTMSKRTESNTTAKSLNQELDKIVDNRMAARIFDRYVSEMAEHLPAVVFASHVTADRVRQSTPVLFLSVLLAASVGISHIDVQNKLAQVLMGTFADAIIGNGEKSLDLVQALLVATIWYRPPQKYEQMNFYQLSHIAAVMAIDIGMGKRIPKSVRTQVNKDQKDKMKHVTASDGIEARRTWLGCYYTCAK